MDTIRDKLTSTSSETQPEVALVCTAIWEDILKRRDKANEARLPGCPQLPWLRSMEQAATLLTPYFKDHLTGTQLASTKAFVLTLMKIDCKSSTTHRCEICKRVVPTESPSMPASAQPAHQAFFKKPRKPNTSSHALEKELSLYLELSYPDDGDLWMPSWWTSHRAQLPHVFLVMQQILCCPASSAASERLFSAFGLIDVPLRNRLSKHKLERLGVLAFNATQTEDCDVFWHQAESKPSNRDVQELCKPLTVSRE